MGSGQLLPKILPRLEVQDNKVELSPLSNAKESTRTFSNRSLLVQGSICSDGANSKKFDFWSFLSAIAEAEP